MSEEPIKHGLNELVALCLEYGVRKPGMAAAIAKIIDDCTDNRDVQIALLTRDLAAARNENAQLQAKVGFMQTELDQMYPACSTCEATDHKVASVCSNGFHAPRAHELSAQLAAAREELAKADEAHSMALQHHADLEQQLAAANATVEKLPRTKDGYPIVPGMTLYFPSQVVAVVLAVWFDGTLDLQSHNSDGMPVNEWKRLRAIDFGYSTRTAAEAAREGKETA